MEHPGQWNADPRIQQSGGKRNQSGLHPLLVRAHAEREEPKFANRIGWGAAYQLSRLYDRPRQECYHSRGRKPDVKTPNSPTGWGGAPLISFRGYTIGHASNAPIQEDGSQWQIRDDFT